MLLTRNPEIHPADQARFQAAGATLEAESSGGYPGTGNYYGRGRVALGAGLVLFADTSARGGGVAIPLPCVARCRRAAPALWGLLGGGGWGAAFDYIAPRGESALHVFHTLVTGSAHGDHRHHHHHHHHQQSNSTTSSPVMGPPTQPRSPPPEPQSPPLPQPGAYFAQDLEMRILFPTRSEGDRFLEALDAALRDFEATGGAVVAAAAARIAAQLAAPPAPAPAQDSPPQPRAFFGSSDPSLIFLPKK
jgi:hypothetical protein